VPKHRFLKKSRLLKELGLALMLLLALGWLTTTFDLAERFYHFSRQFEYMDLDDALFAFSLFLPIYTVAFAYRRYREIFVLVGEANTDALTGLLNQRRTMDLLEREVRRSHRFQRPLSLVVLDIDHFKQINDSFGHPVGDQVLQNFTRLVQESVRDLDHLGRTGGEEFMLITTETDGRGAVDIAERLRMLVESHNYGVEKVVTCSFGVSQLRPGESSSDLIQRTDERLYWAKREGRNQVVGPNHGKT